MKKFFKEINGETIFFEGVLIVGNNQIINPTDDQLIAQGWQEYIEPIPEPPTAMELLAEAKREKIAEIDEYDKSSAVNSFSIGGNNMWLDFELRQQLRTSVEAYQAMNITTVSKWFNNIEYTFTITQWLQMLNALEVYAAEALNVTESHKIAVNALSSIEDVQSYNITTGYPTKISF